MATGRVIASNFTIRSEKTKTNHEGTKTTKLKEKSLCPSCLRGLNRFLKDHRNFEAITLWRQGVGEGFDPFLSRKKLLPEQNLVLAATRLIACVKRRCGRASL